MNRLRLIVTLLPLIFSGNFFAQYNKVVSYPSKENEKETRNIRSASNAEINSSKVSYYNYNIQILRENGVKNNSAIHQNDFSDSRNTSSLNSSNNFLHTETQTVFPYRMEEWTRTQATTFPDEKGKIEVQYSDKTGGNVVGIRLSPSANATEGRLRNEYLKETMKISKGSNLFPKEAPVAVKFVGQKYHCNGVRGFFTGTNDNVLVSVYECGTWLLNIQVSSPRNDREALTRIEESFLQQINPARLTALCPLNLKSNVHFETEALKDTVMTAAIVKSAFRKIEWVKENVDEEERYSGFPDLYLPMHVAALKEYLDVQSRKNWHKSKQAEAFYRGLDEINKAGYLPEFIMEEYQNVMAVPSNLPLRMKDYEQWKSDRPIKVHLPVNQYTITYRSLPY